MHGTANYFVGVYETVYSNEQINWIVLFLALGGLLVVMNGIIMIGKFLPFMARVMRTSAQHRSMDNVDFLYNLSVWEYNFVRFSFIAFPVILTIGLSLMLLGK